MRDDAMRERQLSDQPRFLVRQGSKGWMVYDRERKGPALVGTNPAVDLTKERAVEIERKLMAKTAKPSL